MPFLELFFIPRSTCKDGLLQSPLLDFVNTSLSLLHIRSTTCYACMRRAASVLRGQGGESGLQKRSGLEHGPPHIITIYFVESVRGGRAISSPPRFSLLSDARRAIRFRLSTVYSFLMNRRFIQLRSHMSVKLQENVCPHW